MSGRVRLYPGDRVFEVERGETVLEAALRHGVDLPYNCATGTCGECKGRIHSGRVAEERFHDYRLSAAERQQGYVLLCSVMPDGDLEIEAETLTRGEQIPEQRLQAKIARIETPSPDYRLLHLRTPRSRTLRFLAGQGVHLTVAGHSKRLAIASCPCNGMILQFHLQRDPDDPFVRYLFEQATLREAVEVAGPIGQFGLDSAGGRPIAFVAVGTGFAAVKSLLEQALNLELNVPMRLYWLAEPGGHYQANYCRALNDAVDELEYYPLTVSPGADYRTIAAQLASDVDSLAEWDLYLAGPNAVLAELHSVLKRRAAPGRLFTCGIAPGSGICRFP